MPRLALFALLALAGCTQTRTLVPGTLSATVANAELAGRDVRVALADGRTVAARSVAVGVDSTSWVDPATGALVVVPTADVRALSRRDRDRGAWQAGLLVGVVVGVLLSADLSGGGGGGLGVLSENVGAAYSAARAVPIAFMASGVGHAVGAEDRYRVAPPDSAATGVR